MVGKVLGERYEILEKIGGGGMALVYKARCRFLNRFVAVKILRPEFTEDEEFIKKFKRESQSAASLSHPNIVGIYDVGMEDKIYYIVMEYIKGQTLKDLIKSKGSLGVEYATNIAIQISSAIEHAHKNHIVHRDIKSHNILVKEDNSIKVTDFGIARAVSSSTITNTGNVIGSVHYFSPEQARGGYTDEKSDIYSLGVVMYEMLTGRLPFEGESPIAVALKHIQEEPVRPSELNPRIPKSIEDIVLKCMHKEVLGRYENAFEIISDLKQSLVMPNGDFVKKYKYSDENTKVLEPVKVGKDIPKSMADGAKASDTDLTGSDKANGKQGGKDSGTVRSRRWIIAMVLGGLILAAIVFGGFLLFSSLFSVKEVDVPDLINLSEKEASATLTEVGLIMVITDRVHNMEIPDGQIIRQNPEAGNKNKVTNPVKVVVSKGPMKVIVPNLVGEPYDKVNLILEREGLKEGNFKQEYSDYPNFTVIRQSIASGISVDQGTVIEYVISMGPERLSMPNYIGLDIEEVRNDVSQKDLTSRNIDYEYSSDYKANQVIRQSIAPGTEVSRKTVVDFVVSKGPQPQTGNALKLRFDLKQDLERMRVTVQRVQGERSDNIYDAYHVPADSPLEIPISGQGSVIFEVYINGTLQESMPYTFR